MNDANVLGVALALLSGASKLRSREHRHVPILVTSVLLATSITATPLHAFVSSRQRVSTFMARSLMLLPQQISVVLPVHHCSGKSLVR